MRFIKRPTLELLYKETVITIHIDNRYRDEVLTVLDEIKELDCDYDFKVKKRRNKRSLSANSYAWVLIGKIAEKQRISLTTAYREIIREMAAYEIVPIKEEAVEHWIKTWSSHGTGWVCEDLGPCKVAEGYRYIRCHYGSSTFNTEEMSRFIDLIIQECRELGIEHLTPAELQELKDKWE